MIEEVEIVVDRSPERLQNSINLAISLKKVSVMDKRHESIVKSVDVKKVGEKDWFATIVYNLPN